MRRAHCIISDSDIMLNGTRLLTSKPFRGRKALQRDRRQPRDNLRMFDGGCLQLKRKAEE